MTIIVPIAILCLAAGFCFGALYENTRQKRAKSLPKQVFDEIEEMTALSEKPHHGFTDRQ